MKLSIVIPVYRTQDTIKRCIESILQQSFTDYEIILVDDGSDDACPRICDEYAQKDARIKVIHQKNGGLSDARNTGIKKAQGEYITFVDSDDTIADNTLEVLVKELENYPHVDILEYPVNERYGHKNRQKELLFSPQEYTHPLEYWLKEKGYNHTYACNKIYKRHLFDHIEYPKGKTFEDVWTTPLLIGLIHNDAHVEAQKTFPIIRVTNQGKYIYHWNNKGITAKAKYKDLLNLYEGHTESLLQIFRRMEGQEEEILTQYHHSLEEFMTGILNVLLDLYEESGKYEPTPPLVSKVKWLSKHHSISSWKLKLLNILGYHRLCKINKFIHQIYRRH